MSDITASDVPAGLEAAGSDLWSRSVALYRLGPGHRRLLLEACRLADRLERMDQLIRGDGTAWREFLAGADFDAPEVKLEVSSVLIEARLTATALKGIMTELRQAGAVGTTDAPAQPVRSGEEVGGDVVDILSRRASTRRTPTA